jgi:hypothetical protein
MKLLISFLFLAFFHHNCFSSYAPVGNVDITGKLIPTGNNSSSTPVSSNTSSQNSKDSWQQPVDNPISTTGGGKKNKSTSHLTADPGTIIDPD